MTKRRKTGAETWSSVREMALKDDMEEILAMSDEELDEEIRKAGGDPKEISGHTAALVERLAERRDRLGWQAQVVLAEQEFEKQRAELAARRTKLPREELKRLIHAARNDPRFERPVAALFRDRTTEESTDEELQILLEHIELLKAIVLKGRPES